MKILNFNLSIVVLLLVISCSHYSYYDFDKVERRNRLVKGILSYELVSLEPDVRFCQDNQFDRLLTTDPYFIKNKDLLEYLRDTNIDEDYYYYLLSFLYELYDKQIKIGDSSKSYDLIITVDSIYVEFSDSTESYFLKDYFIRYDSWRGNYIDAIEILPIKIPKTNKDEFYISVNVAITVNSGIILEKRNLHLNAKLFKKGKTLFHTWP